LPLCYSPFKHNGYDIINFFLNSRRAVQKIPKLEEARCSKNAENRGAQFKAKKYSKAIYWLEQNLQLSFHVRPLKTSCTESLREISLEKAAVTMP
jgi:hypothetical protein